MKRKVSRLLSFLLVLTLLTGSIPTPAFAAEAGIGVSGNALDETAQEAIVEEESTQEETAESETEIGEDKPVTEDVSGNDGESDPVAEAGVEPASGEIGSTVTIMSSTKDDIEIDEVNFPDEGFRSYIRENLDMSKDGRLSVYEVDRVNNIYIEDSYYRINSLEGIGYFTNLTHLSVVFQRGLTSVDLSGNTELISVDLFGTNLETLDVTMCTELSALRCFNCKLTSLKVSGLKKLYNLECYNNYLSQLDVSGCESLNNLNCSINVLTALDLTGCTSLNTLKVSQNLLSSLNLTGAVELGNLDCDYNSLTALDLSKQTQLYTLRCKNNLLTSLDVSSCTDTLNTLDCANNQLAFLNTAACTNLTEENITSSGNERTVHRKTKVAAGNVFYYLDLEAEFPGGFDRNKFSDWKDVTNDTVLTFNSSNQLQGLSENTREITYTYDCGNEKSESFTLYVACSDISTEGYIEINEENFPDPEFGNFVKKYDLNGSGYLSPEEIGAVTRMLLYTNKRGTYITDLTGINYFTELTNLQLYGSYCRVETLKLTNLESLHRLELQENSLTSLELENCSKLRYLFCHSNQLTTLDLSGCQNLRYLYCFRNPFVSLKLGDLPVLDELRLQTDYYGDSVELPAYEIELDENGQFDLSMLPGFEEDKASGWDGATVSDGKLTVRDGVGKVRYIYDCGRNEKITVNLKIKGVEGKEGLWIGAIGEQLYTGSAIKPAVEVYSGAKKLIPGKDYTISYKNNVNAQTYDAVDKKGKSIAPTVTVSGKGNYTGTVTRTFTIAPIDLSKLESDSGLQSLLTVEPVYTKYTGKVIKGKPVIKFRGKALSSKCYTLVYPDTSTGAYQNEGEYTITVKGKGQNFKGSLDTTERIVPATNLISQMTIQTDKKSYERKECNEYGLVCPKVTVLNGKTEIDPSCYTIKYLNNDKIGTATILITGKSSKGYYGVKTKTFQITGKKLTSKMVTQITKSVDYTGSNWSWNLYSYLDEEEPYDYKVMDGEEILMQGLDFVVSYPGTEKSYTQPGKFKVTFTGINEYSGSVTKTWTINKVSLASALENGKLYIDYSKTQDYMKGGTVIHPQVNYDGDILKEGVDYTVTCVNNKKPAKGTSKNAPYFYITGKGGFTGNTKSKKDSYTFTINKADIDFNASIMAEDVLYRDKNGNYLNTISVIDKNSGKKLAKGTDYESTITYKYYDNDKGAYVTLDPKGKDKVPASEDRIRIDVTVTGKGDYSGSLTDFYYLYPKSINTGSVVVDSIPNQNYTGNAITPKPTVSLKVKTGKTYTYTPLTEGVHYTVKYSKNVQKGTATVYIYGKGEYGGVKKATFKIVGKKLEWWKN